MLLTAVLLHAPLVWGQDSTTPAPETAPQTPGEPVVLTPAQPVQLTSGDQPSDIGWAFIGAADFGGDTVAKVYFTDGTSQSVDAGEGITLGLGMRYRPYVDAKWGLRSTIAWKFVTTAASNANIGIDRMVWDLVANYRLNEAVWVGGGIVRHMNTHFNGDGFAPDIAFDDAMGLRFEFGWKWAALAFTSMDYTDEFGFEYDASSIGLVLTNAF